MNFLLCFTSIVFLFFFLSLLVKTLYCSHFWCQQYFPSRCPLLHIKVRLPLLLCAVKTVEGDFWFCWMTTPNVGQTHKENPNLVRILYMVCTLNEAGRVVHIDYVYDEAISQSNTLMKFDRN